MAVAILDKTDAETLRKIFGQLPSKWPRFRSRMLKVFD